MSERITVICHDTPFPANHGGKVDMWRRLLALKSQGIKIQMISWDYGDLSEERREAIGRVVSEHHYFQLSRSLRFRVFHLFGVIKNPWFAAIRWPGKRFQSLLEAVKVFSPKVIFLDGWHGALVGLRISSELKIPLVYRAHNVEHLYLRQQRRYARNSRSYLSALIGGIHLRSLETFLANAAELVYVISPEDLRFWASKGFRNIRLLPPLWDYNNERDYLVADAAVDRCGIVFLGNLSAQNNIKGVRWLVDSVMPLVLSSRPSTRLTIAGSNPQTNLVNHLQDFKGIDLLINPVDGIRVLKNAKVAVNPVPTAGGVQIKNIDMLMSGANVVCISAALSGLPDDVRPCFHIGDTPEEFACQILRCLDVECCYCDIEMLDSYFGERSVILLIKEISAL